MSAVADPGKERREAAGLPVVPAFDGFRAYSIMAVVALHLLLYTSTLSGAGDRTLYLVQGTLGQAVDVLFIVSGFVVFLPTVARGGDFGNVGAFAVRRAARLVPAYWLVLALALLLILTVPVTPAIGAPGGLSIAGHVAFLHTPLGMFTDLPNGFGVIGPVWTLSLEVTFYLLLPLIAGWYFRRPLIGLVAAGALTAVWHEAIVNYDALRDAAGWEPAAQTSDRLVFGALIQFPFFAFSFAAGMTGAWVYVRARERMDAERVASRALVVQAIALAGLAVFAFLIGREAVQDGTVLAGQVGRRSSVLALGFSGSLAALMVALALGPRIVQWPFTNPAARWLGDISYGIYLVHLLVITFGVRALGLDTLATAGPVVVAVSVLYGYLSARFVERPVRRWAWRFGRRGQSGVSPYDARMEARPGSS